MAEAAIGETELEQVADGAAPAIEPEANTADATATQHSADDDAGEQAGAQFWDDEIADDLSPETLRDMQREMQKAFTQKTQTLAESRKKVDAYDQFMRDPVQSAQAILAQYGKQGGQPQQTGDPADWQPQSWDEVMDRAERRVLEKMAPVFDQFRDIKKSQIEKQLDESVPDWRLYEDQMAEKLKQHPSLVNDPTLLAKLAIPEDVTKSRAMQAALKRLEAKSKAAKTGSGSTSQRTVNLDAPDGPVSFEQAVAFAKKKLASGA